MKNMPEERQISLSIPSRTVHFKRVNCPGGCNLIETAHPIGSMPSVAVRVSWGGEEGMLYLDPRYGSYENRHSFEIPDGEIVQMSCPHCGADLDDPQATCSLCSGPMFQLQLPHGGILEGCRRKGCVGHRIKFVDLDEQFLRLFDLGIQDGFP